MTIDLSLHQMFIDSPLRRILPRFQLLEMLLLLIAMLGITVQSRIQLHQETKVSLEFLSLSLLFLVLLYSFRPHEEEKFDASDENIKHLNINFSCNR